MQELQVWNVYEVEVEPEDGDDGVERHVGTYASVERARRAVTELHPTDETIGNLTQSGGTVVVVSARAGLWITAYVVCRTTVQS